MIKLRNKKTGENENVCLVIDKNKITVVVADMPLCGNSVLGEYNTLAELNEEWEDYKPAEPLIMGKKIGVAKMLCPHCGKVFEAFFPTPPPIDLDSEKKPRPVIVNGVEYDSYADYLKSREEEE